jgi:hypothetical protein
MATGDLSGHVTPTQVPRDTWPKTSSRWDPGKGRNPHKNRVRVATADDTKRPRDTSSSLTGNAAPAARLTGQIMRGPSQLKLLKVVQFMLRHYDGVHRVGTPSAASDGESSVATPSFAIGNHFVRQPRGDTRVTPEDRRRAVAQRAAEVAERRAVFDANSNS